MRRKFLIMTGKFAARVSWARIAALIVALLFPAGYAGAQPSRAAERPAEPPAFARAVHLVEDQGGEGAGLVIDLTREIPHRIGVLAEPDRLVIDLEGTAIAGTIAPGTRRAGPVSGFRAGAFMLGQSRIVVDLARPALVESADFVRQSGAARLVVQIKPASREAFVSRAAEDRAKRLAARVPDGAAPAERKPGAKPLLVIDPGHGGIDPGASGPKGEMEKDIVLAFALELKRAIEAGGKVEVQLTREDDRFIPLGERVRFATSRGAALFVSLHADSLIGEADVRGAAVYTLSERASDAAAARAAEKENRADLMAGLDVAEEARDGVGGILADLARRETRIFNAVAARDAMLALRKSAVVHKVPLRSAGFRVLRAPDMPSILIELGYLSNPEDLAVLSGEAARQRLSVALAAALTRFLSERRDAISARGGE